MIFGVLVLAFAGLTYAGTYLQWSDAVKTTAEIQGAEQLRARRGTGNVELTVTYTAEGQQLQREVHVSPKRLRGRDLAEGIDVYYKKSKPTKVTSVDVLEDKRDNIPYMLGLGGLLIVAGVVVRLRSSKRT